MQELVVIYRVCGLESERSEFKKERPDFFNKHACFISFIQSFGHKSSIQIVWDGSIEYSLYKLIRNYIPIDQINHITEKNNQKSLDFCYKLARRSNEQYIMFAEDDYYWKKGSYEFLINALKMNYNPITLYDHPDRYLRTENNWFIGRTDESLGRDVIGLTPFGHVRTCESTTCSFACSRDFFNMVLSDLIMYNYNGIGAPLDREFWRNTSKKYRIRLWSALPGLSCHLSLPLAPLINWELLVKSIKI